MRSVVLASLFGLVVAQSSGLNATVSLSSPSQASATSTIVSSSATGPRTALTVAQDGSGQYTAIGAAVSAAQASAIPTVTVLAGTYTEAVAIGQPSVTIVGATATAAADWSQNLVTIVNPSAALSVGSSQAKGLTVRNINFVNSGTSSTAQAAVLVLRGSNHAFYGCSIVSQGIIAISVSTSTAFFANCYIEGSDKLFYNSLTLYVYKSTIVPTYYQASIVYNKGIASGTTVTANSTMVIDSSSIQPKSGITYTGVSLAAPNGNGAVAIFRNNAMDGFIAPAGVHPTAANYQTFYGEFLSSGAGSYASNAAARSKYDVLLTSDQVSQFTIDKVYGNSIYSGYSSTNLGWIDQDILASMQASYASQLASAPQGSSSAPTNPSSSAMSSSSATGSIMNSTSSSATVSVSASISTATSASASTSCSGSSSVSCTASTSASSSAGSSALVSTSAFANSSTTASALSATVTPSLNSTNPSVSASVSASATCSTLPSATIVVAKSPGPCEFGTITSAVNAIPNDGKAYTILVGSGTYVEQFSITRKGKVTLVGETSFTNDYTQNKVRVEFSSGRLTSLGQNEQTPVIYAKKTSDNSGLAVYNIDFVNTYPQTYNTAALAADFYGANIAAYGCSFIGFQDTLLANKGTQVFSNCYIEGSVDFIWGYSTAYFHQCMIVSNTPGACIAAQSRADANTVGGYVFDTCMVTYSSTYGSSFGLSYLGRPYSSFSIAVYMNSYLDKHINPAGWQIWTTSNPQTSGVLFGEYNNAGPGSWQSTTQRASFATQLTEAQAAKYNLAAWIGDTSWLDMTAYNAVPSYSLTGPSSSVPPNNNSTSPSNNGTTAGNGTTTGSAPVTTATINAHPDSGTIPPAGAVIVSLDGKGNATFTSLTSALASLPNDNTNQTIFMYPGSYNEQVPSINRPGAVRIIGYTAGNPGQSYRDNQVTITYSRGLSISPLPAGHSNAETAVFATASSRISLYNINMINTDNLGGLQPNYVTLAGSIYGNDIAFYGCSFDGWQDTLLTGATTGYQYYESCYIGGAIDFIWGYSKAYFKGCTLGAKRKSSCVTAQNRASSSAIGGYIFDQCLFTSAPSATDDLTNSVFLGRPYSQFALVVVKNSYLDKTIQPAGWKIWSPTDPRTGGVTFAEYNNVGPSNWENNAAARQSFGYATLLTSDTYSLSSVMDSTEWIDMTYWNSIVTPQPAVITPPPPGNITTNGTSVVNGTTPPPGALIVSKTPINGVNTYTTIQAALDAAPVSSKTNATIFIYPGVYDEQLIVNKSGYTIFQGYSDATDDFSKNQVTIQSGRGIDTQGTSGSNTDGATVYATGNFFYAYNINFRNNYGTTQNMASLAFAIKSSKYAALYGCQIYGNQDTLSISGNLFTFKTYIEGNVDFIYGSGSAYFLDSTISPNEDGVSITASKRATNGTSAGFVFDQCTLKPAPGTGPFTNVGLGRPWNNLARVAFVDCYLDSMISAAGWNQWSKSTPNTDGVLFGEYHNFGPGSNICQRASFSKQISDADVVQYQLGSFFTTTSWIDFSRVDTQPFSVGIGTAQTCSPVSSASVLPSASSTPVPSLPVVTLYTTTTVVQSLTTSTVLTAPAVTSTTIVKTTETLSISALDVTKTSTEKATLTVSITSPDVTITSTSIVTQDVGLTITPNAVTKTSVIQSTITVGSVTTKAADTSTIKATSTVTEIYSSTPKADTITQSQGSTIIVTSTVRPKDASTTVSTTTSVAPSSTKTSTVKPDSSVTVTTTSYKTTTKKSTTTLSCIPTEESKRMVRRGAVIPRAAASTTTITSSTTVTSIVKTSTVTQPGATIVATQTSTILKTTSLKASTVTSVITATVATRTSEQAGQTFSTVVVSTSSVGKTTTLKPSTTTVFSTDFETKTSISTVFANAVTITSFKTTTVKQTVVAQQQTVTITMSEDVRSTTKITLPVFTNTVYRTITEGGGVVTETVTAAPGTKTVAQKITTTVMSTATKTAKGAKTCTA